MPAQPWFMAVSLLASLLLDMLPTAPWPGMPDWLMLVLAFWSVREWRTVGMGWAFVFGIAMDVADGAALGQHALAYVLLTYGAAALSRRMLWFSLPLQALHVLPLFLLAEAVQVAARMLAGGDFPGWTVFIAPFVATLLWPLASLILLAPQYRPVERDENRPI